MSKCHDMEFLYILAMQERYALIMTEIYYASFAHFQKNKYPLLKDVLPRSPCLSIYVKLRQLLQIYYKQ